MLNLQSETPERWLQQVEAQQDVEVVGGFVGLDADRRELGPADGGEEVVQRQLLQHRAGVESLLEAQPEREAKWGDAGDPTRQRRALVLKQYHDMKYSEIAESMQLSVPAVQMLLHRAMQALRKEFSSRGGRP